jgi:hypothetical protein
MLAKLHRADELTAIWIRADHPAWVIRAIAVPRSNL